MNLKDIGKRTECREHKYLKDNFNQSGTDNKTIEGRIMEARRAFRVSTAYCELNK